MPLDNFRFFAMQYLNDWCADDRRFVAGLAPTNEKAKRLDALRDAAAYYKVIRNFKTIEEPERLDGALAALDRVSWPVNEETLDATVNGLAVAFQSVYGMNVISAASKFLWLRCQSPVVIYDDRAIRCLRSAGCRFGQCDYGGYRVEWRAQFAVREETIRSACCELRRVKEFSRAHAMAGEEFENITGSGWFQERVFDKYLWWNSDAS